MTPARILTLFKSLNDKCDIKPIKYSVPQNVFVKHISYRDDEFETNSERNYHYLYLRAILSGCGLACGIGSECDCPSAKASDPGTGTGDP